MLIYHILTDALLPVARWILIVLDKISVGNGTNIGINEILLKLACFIKLLGIEECVDLR